MQQVLEHDALAAGALVLAQPLGHLGDGADEGALGVGGEPVVERRLTRHTLVQLFRPAERIGRDPATMRFSTMTGCVIGTTRDDALERARQLYGRAQRDVDFETWLDAYAQRAIIGSVAEAAARLREYKQAGCERVMLQHLLHADLEPVRLIGRELAPLLA